LLLSTSEVVEAISIPRPPSYPVRMSFTQTLVVSVIHVILSRAAGYAIQDVIIAIGSPSQADLHR
jgi:hypothetical protein